MMEIKTWFVEFACEFKNKNKSNSRERQLNLDYKIHLIMYDTLLILKIILFYTLFFKSIYMITIIVIKFNSIYLQ